MPERRKKRDGGKKIVEVIEPKLSHLSIHPRPSGRESEAKMITANEVEK